VCPEKGRREMGKEVRVDEEKLEKVLNDLKRAKLALEGKPPNIKIVLDSLTEAIGILEQIVGGA
jgi:hypothetical protein